MDPLALTAITTLVQHLGKQLLSKSFDTTVGELTKDGYKWVKSIFYKPDDTPKDVLTDLKAGPEDPYAVKTAELAVEKSLKENPGALKYLVDIYNGIKEKQGSGERISIQIDNSDHSVKIHDIESGGKTIIKVNQQK